MHQHLRTTAIGLGAAACAVVTAGVAAPAVAATPFHPTVSSPAGRPVSASPQDGYSSVAGYGADLSGLTAPSQWTVTESFVVPAVVCTASTASPLFVQLFVNGTGSDGSGLGSGGYVVASCNGTAPSYSTNVSSAGGQFGGVNGTANAGDRVTISFKGGRRSVTTTLSDLTSGQQTSQVGTGLASFGGAQVSVQGGFDQPDFPAFRRVTFSNLKAGGQPFQSFDPFRFDATDAAGNVVIAAGPFDSSGRSFTASPPRATP